MRYLFLGLLALNVLMFGYYSFMYQPAESQTVTQASLTNPVTATNVSDELPPMIGTKK